MTYTPTPKFGYLPFIITNNTGVSDSEVYVLFEGDYKTTTSNLYFFGLNESTSPPMGVYYPVIPQPGTLSANYSYPLSSLPKSSTGDNDYLVYVPSCPSNRFYFSINSPMYLQADSTVMPTNIAAPTYYAFYDPNYSNLFESIEMSFILNPASYAGPGYIYWTSSINTTEVDAFGIPMRIQYQSYNPASPSSMTPIIQDSNALPSGFGVGGLSGNTTRGEILTSVVSSLTSGDLTGQTPKIWPKLAIPFYTNPYAKTGLQTYLRVLSPKQSLGNDANPTVVGNLTTQHLAAVNGNNPTTFYNYNYPPFPMDYLTNNIYGNANSFATNAFTYYQTNPLYISTGGGSPLVYEGISTGSEPTQTLTFTQVGGSDRSTFDETDMNTFKMYSGSQIFSGGSFADQLGFYFGDAFTVNFIGGTVGSQNTASPPNDAINITDAITWEPYYISRYYTSDFPNFTGGPWMDLYANSLHNVAIRNTSSTFLDGVGLCYAYDFDDSLGFSGTITPSNITPLSLSPYASITLGVVDTSIPDPYSDSNTYNVTFNFPSGSSYALEYSNGGGYTSVTSGQTVNGLTSNRATPLNLHYTNGQGPTGDHYFNVYLYYQFLQPTGAYDSSTDAIINASTFTPNSSTPTGFTINLLP